MTLHWVMYEKSMGMCAADICESVLAHAKRRFATNVHVLSSCDTAASGTAAVPAPLAPSAGGREVDKYLMIVGDSELACAAREAKALHGMLTTIHEVRSGRGWLRENKLCMTCNMTVVPCAFFLLWYILICSRDRK